MYVTKKIVLRRFLVSVAFVAGSLQFGMIAHSQTVLKAAFFQPAGNPSVELAQEAMLEIEKKTEGRVKFKIFPSSTLVPTVEMGSAVDDGTAFMAVWYLPYMSKTIPLFDIETVPVWTAGTCDAIVSSYENGLSNLYERVLARQNMKNVKVAGVSMCLPRVLGTTERQVKVPADAKGLKIRSVAAESEMFTGIGANAVNMVNDQIYESLSRGIINGMTNAFMVMDEHRHLERLKYVVNTDLSWVLMHVIYNEKMLNKVDVKDREIVKIGMKHIADHIRNGLYKKSEQSTMNAPGKYGVTIYEPTKDERKLWAAAADKTKQTFEARADSDPLIKEGLAYVRKYNP